MFTNKDKQVLSTKVRAGVFFDGTGNNAKNLLSKGITDDYNFTNIYRLYKTYGANGAVTSESSKALKIYVEGVGTKDGEDNNYLVEASGIDFLTNVGWGVFSKFNDGVNRLCSKIKEHLMEINAAGNRVEIELDVFGFSRGAAIARHFVNEITDVSGETYKTLQDVISSCGYELSDGVTINFLGLFDTVATVWNFKNALWSDPHASGSTNGLKVNLPQNIAKNVFQIAAMHECRYNFPLSSLQGHYPELVLAGCHSDIGGNMLNDVQELAYITNKYIKHPFGTSAYDSVTDEISDIRKSKIWNELLSKYEIQGGASYDLFQQGVSIKKPKGDLQYVSLLVMYQCASRSGCVFDDKVLKDYNNFEGALKEYYEDALENMIKVTSGSEASLNQSYIDNITEDYIHISASWEIVINELFSSEQQNSEIKPLGSKKVGCIFGNIWPDRPDSHWNRKVFLNNQKV